MHNDLNVAIILFRFLVNFEHMMHCTNAYLPARQAYITTHKPLRDLQGICIRHSLYSPFRIITSQPIRSCDGASAVPKAIQDKQAHLIEFRPARVGIIGFLIRFFGLEEDDRVQRS
jgi:hypothetical protein